MSGVSRRSILVGTAGGVLGGAAAQPEPQAQLPARQRRVLGTAPVGRELGDRADSSHRRGR